MKFSGALIEAKDEGISIEKGAGVWGWVTVNVNSKPQWAVGKLLGVIGDGVLVLVDSAENIIDTCEDQYRQRAADENRDALLEAIHNER